METRSLTVAVLANRNCTACCRQQETNALFLSRGTSPSTSGARRVTALRLLQESEFGAAKIQCLRQWVTYWRPGISPNNGTQAIHNRLPPEEGQMLTTPIQPPRFHLSVYNRHPPYIRPPKHRSRRTFRGWGNHGACIRLSSNPYILHDPPILFLSI